MKNSIVSPVLTLISDWFGTGKRRVRERIAADLRECGVRRGGTLLVHSSLSSMGRVPGGAETVIRGLFDALGQDGTLLLPALSYRYVDAGHPVFDVLRTPSCVGAIPEYFRTRPGTARSVHPTHSVCGVGPRVEELFRNHHLDATPCGPNSPFRALRDGGQLLMLGCGLRPNTSMHSVEEVAMPPYLLGDPVKYRIILADGTETTMDVRRHGAPGYHWGQRYERLGPFLGKEGLRVGKVLKATVHLIECRIMWERALEQLGKDPFCFVDQTA